MGTGRTDEFRKEAVRIALTSGLSRRQVADDLGVGFSTLNKWVSAHRGTGMVSAEDRDLAQENERLRREVRILKEERDILKSHPVLREPKAVRFRFVEEQRGAFPVDRLCRVMNVSPRGLRAYRSRPASRRQRTDMVVLAHIKEQSRLSLGSYGRPRMTEELKCSAPNSWIT
jgi:transposase-like protein